MKNHYIELIEKTAADSLFLPRVVKAGDKRTSKENKFIRENDLETYQPGTDVETSLLMNADNIVNGEKGYAFVSTGKGTRNSNLTGTSVAEDLARIAAKKQNREAEYDRTLDSIRKPINTRTAVGKGAKSALTIGGALAGAAASGMGGIGPIPGAVGGLIAGGLLGSSIKNKVHKTNNNQYLNSLEGYQRESIESALQEKATKAANNPYTHQSILATGGNRTPRGL